MQDEIRLGRYCVNHHITIDDLQLFSNEILKYKTFNLDENRKHFRNFQNVQNHVLTSGDLLINLKDMTLKKDGRYLSIRKHEFLILCLLVSNSHEIISDHEIMDLLKNYGHMVSYRSMVVYLSRISLAVGESPIDSKYVKRKRNKGYYWDYFVQWKE